MTSYTFDNLWAEFEPRRVRGKKSQGETTRLYETHIRPTLAARRIDKTGFKVIDQLHQDMSATPYQANRVLALLRIMYKYAAALEWVAPGYNPARDVVFFPERKRKRHMKPSEAPRIAAAIRDYEASHRYACLFLWLLIFTGARSGEIKKAKWRDLDGDVLTLDEHKSDRSGDARVIVLSQAAIDAIDRLIPLVNRNPDSKIIPLVKPEYLWTRTLRKMAKVYDLRVHDLRHTFGTYAMDNGFTLDQIGEALNHANVQTTKIYAELTNRKRRAIAGATSLAILQDMNIEYAPEPEVDVLS